MPMGSLNANKTNQEGNASVGAPTADRSSAISLIATLDAVDVVGPQMFERDCLGYSFDLWTQADEGLGLQAQITSSDILADIADIRNLPNRHPEVTQVDVDLLAAIADIEAYVVSRQPTIQ